MEEKQVKVNNYLVITIEDPPRCQLIPEAEIHEKIIQRSPIYHSWLRNDDVGIVGIKISSWMINFGRFTKAEKEIIDRWIKLDSDMEISFGNKHKHNEKNSTEDLVLYTSILKLNKTQHGISFPMFGPALDKKEVVKLEANLNKWIPA